ncbi:MAG: helix-turn-helix domain-containing protein [Chitinophagaceae bacterium]
MKWRALLAIVFVLVVLLSWSIARSSDRTTAFENAGDIVLMRQIGHEILLASGDSVSRVMPVEKAGDNQYLLKFESPFAFSPDSLVKVISGRVSKSHLPQQYIVSVQECGKNDIVYAYSIPPDKENDIPCLGRPQPLKRYEIKIMFQPATSPKQTTAYVAMGGLLMVALSFAGWYRYGKKPSKQPAIAAATDPSVAIGQYAFYPSQQLLVLQQQRIELTAKEARLLSIFAGHINEVIDRSQLQKEGWEDEGVITGRSLDMFVSKLRKRLQDDPAVKLVNIHGKGYKLEVIA